MSERSTRASSAPTEEDISLRHVIDAQHRLDELGTARLVGDAAEAVHKAQTGGQPLGTLSPTAIFVVATGRVKLQPPKSPNTAYCAPERLRGSAGDRRSDVFSLGVILWEALAHARLFQGATDDAIKTAVLDGEIRPPSEANANIPAELDAICKKALARDPADRYQSAKVMAAEISAVLDEAGYPEGNEDIARYLGREFPDGPPVELVLKPPVIALNTPKPKTAEPTKLDPKATILGVAPELKEAVKAAAAKESSATIQDAVKAVVKAADEQAKDAPEHTAVDGKAMDAKHPGDFAAKLPTTLPPPKTAKPAETNPPETKPAKAPTPAAGVTVKAATPAKGVPTSTEGSSLPAWARANGTAPPATQPVVATAAPTPPATPPPATIVEPSPSQTLPGMPSAIGSSPIPPITSAPTAAVPATGSAPPAILTSPPTSSPAAPTMLASHPGMVLPPLPPGATTTPPAAGAKTAILGSTDANAELKAAIAADGDTEPMPAMGTKPPPVAAKPSISNAETVPTPALAAQPAQPPPLPSAATATAAPAPTKRPGSHSDDFAEEKSAPHPAAAVTLPRARTRGDKTTGKHDPIGGWGWGTDSHEAITAHEDDDYYDDSAARQKKRLLIAIGSAVGAILLVTIVAFAMKGGGKSDEKKEEVSATKPNDTNTAVDWKSSPGSGSAQPTEPPKVEGSAAEPPKSEGSATEPTAGSGSATEPPKVEGSAAEPPKQEAMVAPPPAPPVEPAKPEPPKQDVKPEPPKVEPKKPEPPKVEPKKPPEVAAKKPEPKKPEIKKPTPPPAPKKPPEVAVKKPADPKPVDPYATVATPAPKADSAAAYKTGVQQLAKGDANGALATFKASLAQNPGFAPTWRGIGLVYERMGKKSQAKTAFQRYLQLNPNAGDADAIRERLERLGS